MNKELYENDNGWEDLEDPWFTKSNITDVILDKISILDILDKYKIEYIQTSSGNFTHKLRCPFPAHLGGQERTASLCLSDVNNDFHCFGCNANGSVIDFIMLYRGVPFYKALEILYGYIDGSESLDDIPIRERVRVNPEHTVMPYIFKAGVTIREHLKLVRDSKNYYKWCEWANLKFKKMDIYLDQLDDNDWKVAKKYYENILDFIEKNK